MSAVLVGYAGSFERTLETFYERVQPYAPAFMALFGRERLPHRSTLSRFLAALDQATVEALRALLSPRSPGSPSGTFGESRRRLRPRGDTLPSLRCGWDTTSCSSTSLAPDG
jgi:hypothetical protein